MTLRGKFEKWLLYNYPGTFDHDTDNSREEWEMTWDAFQRGYELAKKQFNDIENTRATDALENSLKPTRSTPRTPINEVDY